MNAPETPAAPIGSGWNRATLLFGVVLSLSILQPTVLVAVPLAMLLVVGKPRGRGSFLLGVIAVTVVAWGWGTGDPMWWFERGWALAAAVAFVAFTTLRWEWPFSQRAIASVGSAIALIALGLAARAGSWAQLDTLVDERVRTSVAASLELLELARDGQAAAPALVTGMYEMAEFQIQVFPALIGVSTVAALGVAWWIHLRVAGTPEEAIGPVRDFRFNDHLVWLMIGGMALIALRVGDGTSRIGMNLVVFMSAFYALRGVGVAFFLAGGLNLITALFWTLAAVFAAPILFGTVMLVGISDTWLDLRARAERAEA